MGLPSKLELPKALRGDTFGPITITYAGPSLVGASAIITFRKNSPTGTVVQTLTSDNSEITLTGTTTGTIVVLPFRPNTTGTIYWDLQLTFADDTVRTIYKDKWVIDQDITLG